MPVVSFWNPVETSQASTTSSIAAVATMLPAKCKYRTYHFFLFNYNFVYFSMFYSKDFFKKDFAN